MKTQVEKIGNMTGVEERAGEGAFSPTPDVLAQIAKAIREELETMKNTDRAIESLEFARRIEKAATRVLGEHGVDSDVEYLFDEYPTVRTYVRIVDDHVSWERVKAADLLRAGTTEIIIYYEADVLQVKSEYYIKLDKFEVMVRE
jgi:hypothetical protein